VDIDDVVKKIVKIGGERVLFVLLFGSRARGDARPDSDIDLAVYYEGDEKERFRFRILAAGELPDNVDLHVFQDLPLYVVHQALREGELVYVRDRNKAVSVLLRASRDAEDFMYRMRVIAGAV